MAYLQQVIEYEILRYTLYINIFILGVLTEKPYSKAVERNEVYVSIITSGHASSHDGKWRQNKPWSSIVWSDVMTSLTLFRCSL